VGGHATEDMVRWRRDLEVARPWVLLQFGLLSLVAGWLMARFEEGTAVNVFGLVPRQATFARLMVSALVTT
jgi:hypothetical protein